MSQWTQVVGALRLDGIMCNKYFRNTGEIINHFLEDIPEGSEGPLELSLIFNKHESSLCFATLTISGSLRDYDDAGEILEWLTVRLSAMPVGPMGPIGKRDVAMSIEVEGSKGYFIVSDGDGLALREVQS